MKRQIIIGPQYEEDLAAHFAVIFKDKPEPALRFIEVADESAQLLAEMPLIGTAFETNRPLLQGIRSYPMPKHYRNYVIFYRAFDDRIELLTMLHGARDLESALERVI
jgi:toxin ParE1/3/4